MVPATPDRLGGSAEGVARELLEWRPAQGLLSVYVDADPADRSAAWKIELKNSVGEILAAAEKEDDRELSLAVRATAERVLEELAERAEVEPRGLLGFVEVSRDQGEERWFSSQLPPRRTEVVSGPVAHLHPLLELLDDGAAIGVVLSSAERVRLLEWQLGRLEELHDWELSVFMLDWRERKAERSDPARGTATSASGHDQFDQRLEANRDRFSHQVSALVAEQAKVREWRAVLLFGEERHARHLEDGFRGSCELRHVERADLISEPAAELERRLEEAIAGYNRDRERALIERVKEAAFAEGRSALGPQETVQSLSEGRVEHLVYDAERDYSSLELSLDGLRRPQLPLADWMIELALSTGASVTPVEGESAEALAEQDGVAALLRY